MDQEVVTPTPTRRIFVYGSLRRDEYNHQRVQGWGLGQLAHVCDGYIIGAKLYNLGSYPCIVNGGDFKVEGEVYEVPDQLYFRIDGMEQGAGYKRQAVKVKSTDSSFNHDVDAEAYFYNHPDELSPNQLIPSGDWSKRSK